LNLKSNVKNRIMQLYLEAKKKLALLGYSFDEIVAGLIFVSGILENDPIPIYKISKITGVKPKVIWSLSTSIYKSGITKRLIRIPDVVTILKEKLPSSLNEEEKQMVQKAINEHLSDIKKKVGNITPRAVAGAVLWLLGKRKILKKRFTQKELARIFETNEVSIRIAAKKIRYII